MENLERKEKTILNKNILWHFFFCDIVCLIEIDNPNLSLNWT